MTILGQLIQNATLLLSLVVTYSLFIAHLPRDRLQVRLLSGLLFGLTALVGMTYPVTLEPGVFFDGRTLVAALAGVFGGVPAAAVTALIASAYRIWIGGAGVIMGVGTILTAAILGVFFHVLKRRGRIAIGLRTLALFGLLVHGLCLPWVLTLTPGLRVEVLNQVALPFMIVLPIVGVLLGMLLHDQERRIDNEQSLRESEARLLEAKRIAGLGYWEWDLSANRHTWSKEVFEIYGLDPDQPALGYQDLESYFSPASWSGLNRAMERAIEEGIPYQCDAELVRGDDTHMWITMRGEAIRDAAGRIKGLHGTIQDITERKRLSEELANQRGFLATLIQTIPDLVWLKDPDGVYLACNRRFEHFFGAAESEIQGRTDRDFMSEEDAAFFRKHDLKALEAGGPSVNEESITFANDGHQELLETIKTPMRDPDGRLIGVLGIARDISDLRRAQTALQERVKELKCLYAVFRETEQSAERPLETMLKAVLAHIPTGWQYPEITVAQIALGELILSSPGFHETPWMQHARFSVLGRAGRISVAYLDEREPADEGPFLNEERDLLDAIAERLMGAVEHRDALRMLRERERIYSAIVNQAADSIGLVDTQTGRFVEFNTAAHSNLGYSREEFSALTITDLDAAHDPETLVRNFDRISARNGDRFVTLHRHKDGRLHDVQVSVRMIEIAGRLYHAAIWSDITKAKQAERELLQHRHHLEELVAARTEELAAARDIANKANLAKSAFLANMSHEIRTPLNAITGMAHLIRLAGLNPAQTERMDKLEAAGEHLISIINAILDLAKIEAGKLTLDEEAIDITKLPDMALSMLADRIQAKQLDVVTEIDEIPWPLVADVTRLRQALLNYLSNAVKFTDRGHIGIRLRLEEADDTSALVRFEVEDTGIGISSEILPRLFTTFEQADNALARKHAGTGLGLAITRRLARLMGGDAGASSTLGQGSSFWFSARLEKAPFSSLKETSDRDQTTEMVLQQNFPGCCILLAEDEPINREIAQSLLEDAGLSVDIAVDGREAVRLATQKTYRLILMDMQMPEMDGLEATRVIRREGRCRETPIIAMTANAFADDKARCLEAGMNDFIAKPVDPDTLYASMFRWLSSSGGSA